MNHLSLFSGIGDFDLAAEWMGWENVAHCEMNEFCLKVLNYYWPNAKTHTNIKSTDFTVYRGTIDIVTGGFPCQPYSVAGQRKGTDDERHLWPQMLRAIREVQPAFVVGENVPGLINWNGGLVFEQVQVELEAEGYEVIPFILPAAGVNAPHKRERIWFIGYSKHNGLHAAEKRRNDTQPSIQTGEDKIRKFKGTDSVQSGAITHADSTRVQKNQPAPICNPNGDSTQSPWAKSEQQGRIRTDGKQRISTDTLRSEQQFKEQRVCKWNIQARNNETWNNWPTVASVCNGDDGLSARLDGITFSKWRNESIKAGGNAIVPQVAHQIFKAIQQFHETLR